MRLPAAFVAAVLVCAAVPSAAQSVKLEFNNGRVSLAAENVTVRAILTEWARRGGTRMVNVERVTGSPVTLELTGVPEQQAIEVLLRGVAGYMIGWRETGPEVPTSSAFDRLMILPTSTVVRTVAPPPPPVPQRQPLPAQNPDDLDGVDDAVIGANRPATRVRDVVVPPEPDEDDADAARPTTTSTPFGNIPTTARPGVITPPAPSRRPAPLSPDDQ